MSDREAFLERQNVPRGTIDKLDVYQALLEEWQARMNLVAASTLEHIWSRHFEDSLQLADIATNANDASVWLDIGSGAGFPALVLALVSPGRFHLVETTAKKCRFLEAVVNRLGLQERVTVHNCRIEALPVRAADFITARACASLAQLFEWGLPHGRSAQWLLLKGRSVADEVAAAQERFTFDCELVTSRTAIDARIVSARDVRRRQ